MHAIKSMHTLLTGFPMHGISEKDLDQFVIRDTGSKFLKKP